MRRKDPEAKGTMITICQTVEKHTVLEVPLEVWSRKPPPGVPNDTRIQRPV